MADVKITALPVLTAADPINDAVPIVDVSDNTITASGTTKRISINNILGASGTATLASATISGALTVDTTTLVVNAAGYADRVGIGTASPATILDIQSAGSIFARIQNTASSADAYFLAKNTVGEGFFGINATGPYIYTAASLPITFTTATLERYRIASDGVATWSNVGGVATTAMTLNATGLGLGGPPSARFEVFSGFIKNTATTGSAQIIANNTGGVFTLAKDSSTGGNFTGTAYASVLYSDGAVPVCIFSNGSERLRIDSSGNVGIGVTPAGTGGCLQLKSGITFPVTQVASSDANTLDDYVETTFSPTIVGSTTAGTATYSLQTGRATKVGRLVTFSLRVAYSAGSGTGNLRVGGLPFTAGVSSVFAIYAENIALTAGNYPVCSISSGNTFIGIDQLPTGGGAASAVPYDVAGDIQISGSYIV